MATLHPAGWRQLQVTGSARREIETLAVLERALPDAFTVYHGVHWTRFKDGFSLYGEIDFAVVAPNARVLFVEQKSGFLEETADGLHKVYADKRKSVADQMLRTVEHVQARYARARSGERMCVDALLYCPDHVLKNPAIAGLDPALIVDARRRDQLPAVIQAVLREGEDDPARVAVLRRFFAGELQLVPDIGAVSQEARALYSRISDGLAVWGRRFDVSPFRLRVTGTAGSGKTQLALGALHDAAAAGRRALYVCFNRPLAEHMAQIVPAGALALTYHQLCDRVLRSLGRTPDFSDPEVFARLEAGFAACSPGDDWRFDELIVDEGQDFAAAWVPALLALLRPDGRAWWLEDPMQNLYGRPPVDLPGWARLHADTNYRSPQDVLALVNRLLGPGREVRAGSPLIGSDWEVLTYPDRTSLIESTKKAITRCVALGFKRSMIATLTYRGREHSALFPFDALGPHALRRFTGEYDLLGSPLYTDGDVLLETVLRFKGQSAPAVVLTEIDFETFDETALRRLFVGATRATMKLILVTSERAAKVLLEGVTDQAARGA
jgi:hypothetical protein